MTTANISVLAGKNFACVRVSGRASFACSPDFKAAIQILIQKGCQHFIIDLTECVLMDSTFLGILAGFGIRLNAGKTEPDCGIVLHNPCPRVSELLENLGAAPLFKLTTGELQLPSEVAQIITPPTHHTHEQITRTSLEAHQTLMDMTPENAVRFKDVAQFLAEDLKNHGLGG